ncbi:hypothetical protein AAZX31_19G144300 [Glycine max]
MCRSIYASYLFLVTILICPQGMSNIAGIERREFVSSFHDDFTFENDLWWN